jgi:hypothetical protein
MKPDKVRIIEGDAIKQSLFDQLHKVNKLDGTEKLIGVVKGYALVFETQYGALGWIHWLDFSEQVTKSVMPQESRAITIALKDAQDRFFKQTPQLYLV